MANITIIFIGNKYDNADRTFLYVLHIYTGNEIEIAVGSKSLIMIVAVAAVIAVGFVGLAVCLTIVCCCVVCLRR